MSAGRALRGAAGLALGALLLAGCGGRGAFERHAAATPADSGVAAARAFYAMQPRFLSPVPWSPLPDGLPDLRAETCGACHEDIYQEWQLSAHAQAWLGDPQYLEELKKPTATPGRDASWICMNCHTPLQQQLPRLVTGLEGGNRGRPIYVANAEFDSTLQLEAITCATCHVRDGFVLGPYGDTHAPHAVKKSDDLRSAALCTQCHEANEQMDDVSLACVFDTGRSFAAGPSAAEGKVCQDCHMPAVTRSASNFLVDPRPARHHWFGGSRVPKRPELAEALAALDSVYPDGARIAWVDRPTTLRAGAEATLSYTVTNAEAGHSLPTGDVERFIIVTVRVLDAAGHVVAERQDRFGARFEWEPTIRKVEDTRLAPRETRTFALPFRAPARPGNLTLQLDAVHWRMSEENFAYHRLEGRSVRGRTFFTASDRVRVK